MKKDRKKQSKPTKAWIPRISFQPPDSQQRLWDEFRTGLSLALYALDDQDYLIIEPKNSKNDASGYVQFAGFGQDGIRAEVSSEQFCKFPLGKKKSKQMLKHLGWNSPTYRQSDQTEPVVGSCNYYVDATVGDISVLATSIIYVLQKVLLIKAPYHLKYRSFSNIKNSVHFRSLGIDSVDKLRLSK